MLISREKPADVDGIRTVTAAAFDTPDRTDRGAAHAQLVDQLRADPAWLPELSLVAVEPGRELVGHVVCTRGYVDGTPALALGPLSVRPDRQGQGVGSALVHAVLGAADALGEPLVALLGDPKYYSRFGFVTSTDHGIQPSEPEWGVYFQVRPLTAHSAELTGVFRYPTPFDAF